MSRSFMVCTCLSQYIQCFDIVICCLSECTRKTNHSMVVYSVRILTFYFHIKHRSLQQTAPRLHRWTWWAHSSCDDSCHTVSNFLLSILQAKNQLSNIIINVSVILKHKCIYSIHYF